VRKGPAIVAIAAFLAASWARSSRADDAEPIRVEWVADPGCPTADDFWRSLSERTERVRRAGDEASRVFHIELHAKAAARFDGSLRVTDMDASTSSRVVSSATCDSAAEALAFFAALAIDPNAHERRPIAAHATSPPSPPVVREEPRASRPRPRAVRPPPASPSSWIVDVALGIGAGVILGVLPSARVLLSSASVTIDASKGRALLAPGFRLSVAHASSGAVGAAAGDYAIAWTVAALDACALRAGASIFEGRLCATGEVGEIHGEGFEVAAPISQTRAWGAIGGAARGRVRLLRVLAVELRAALLAPVVRDRFFFADGATVHEIAPLGARIDLALLAVFLELDFGDAARWTGSNRHELGDLKRSAARHERVLREHCLRSFEALRLNDRVTAQIDLRQRGRLRDAVDDMNRRARIDDGAARFAEPRAERRLHLRRHFGIRRW
jgi:hypothetical protein